MAYGAAVARSDAQPTRLAQLIRAARDGRRWSQERLAEESGVGRSTIIRWEHGKITEPAPAELIAVVDALGVAREDAFIAVGWLDGDEREGLLAGLANATREEIFEALRHKDQATRDWVIARLYEERSREAEQNRA